MREITADIAIIGGGAGGFAAAMAACEAGRTVVMTEPTDWIGGQFTSQAVPPDEHRWIEAQGGDAIGNRSYVELRRAVRRWYRENRSLTPAAAAHERLNPGNGWVSHLCAEPRVWHAVMMEALRPHVEAGRLKLLLEHEPVRVEMQGDRIDAVHLRDTRGTRDAGSAVVVRGKIVLDATETGDLYELGGVEHLIGAEHQNDFGEMHGRTDRADWRDQQGISWCFALEHRPGEDHIIAKPAAYEWWRSYVPTICREPGLAGAAWPGTLLSWTVASHNQAGKHTFPFVPWPHEPRDGEWEMWRYRRIVDRAIYLEQQAAEHPDVCLVNWVQMDYWQRPLLGVSAADRALALREAREQSLCLLYWMQTEAPRPSGVGIKEGVGFPGLKLRGDELGTNDGFAKAAYIREPRRLLARTMLSEAHLGTEQRRRDGRPNMDFVPPGMNEKTGRLGMGEAFADSIAIGHYTLDLHPSCSGRNSVYVPASPYRIPLGSLVPVRVENLIAAGKGIGVTHVANGCSRMHHTEYAIGEAAGVLAAQCVEKGLAPASVHASAERTKALQERLAARGVAMRWPWEK
jgi:hypothetical protein